MVRSTDPEGTDVTDQRSLTNKNVVIIFIFLIGVAITATHFISTEVIAKNATPVISVAEKALIVGHLNKEMSDALERQKIYLEQKAFNDKILQSLKQMNQELGDLNLGYKKHVNSNSIHYK